MPFLPVRRPFRRDYTWLIPFSIIAIHYPPLCPRGARSDWNKSLMAYFNFGPSKKASVTAPACCDLMTFMSVRSNMLWWVQIALLWWFILLRFAADRLFHAQMIEHILRAVKNRDSGLWRQMAALRISSLSISVRQQFKAAPKQREDKTCQSQIAIITTEFVWGTEEGFIPAFRKSLFHCFISDIWIYRRLHFRAWL